MSDIIRCGQCGSLCAATMVGVPHYDTPLVPLYLAAMLSACEDGKLDPKLADSAERWLEAGESAIKGGWKP